MTKLKISFRHFISINFCALKKAIGLCCALGCLIIAVIVYWNVHRKRKATRLQKVEEAKKDEENMKEAVKAMSLPIEPHATYLQTLMTLTNQTLSKFKILVEIGSFLVLLLFV